MAPPSSPHPDPIARIAQLLGESAGLQFEPSRLKALQAAARDRARAERCATLDAYLALLADPARGPEELRALTESVTIHETSFFRNREHYRALREVVLPDLAHRRLRAHRLRIWSAGCATGEEAYSLAITCLEQSELAGWDIHIEASDLSESALAVARRGAYRAPALRCVELEQVQRWFQRRDEEMRPAGARHETGPLTQRGPAREVFHVSPAVRALVHFSALNLAQSAYPAQFADFDLILCENVIIYLRPDVTRAIIERFYQALRPGGYLFLGYSETLWQISDRFRLITQPHTFFYQRPPAEPRRMRAAVTTPLPDPAARRGADLQDLLRKLRESAQPADIAAPMPRPSRVGPPPTPRGRAPAPAGEVEDPSLAIATAAQWTREGQEHLEAGRYAEALAAFNGALSRNPAEVNALMGLAQIHANQGRLAEARAECARVLQIDALCEEAHLLNALIARQEGLPLEAADHLEKLLYVNFESVAGHYHLAEIYRAAGRDKEAAREYRRTLWALDRAPSDAPVSGIPPALIRGASEQQLARWQGA
jgi:chemotaxis protein methyltransferase CheR